MPHNASSAAIAARSDLIVSELAVLREAIEQRRAKLGRTMLDLACSVREYRRTYGRWYGDAAGSPRGLTLFNP